MQKVAAFLLERREGMEWSSSRAVEAKLLRGEIHKWLSSKGASPTGQNGTFKPEDGSTGSYSIDEAVDGDSAWWMLRLEEVTKEGQRFRTTLSVTSSDDRVSVYVTLEVGWTTARIMPVSVDPRCPRIVRDLLSLAGRWYLGASTFQPLRSVKGFQDGEALAAEIAHSERSLPVIVVSADQGKIVLPELDAKLAYDLAGLANIVGVDEDAAWALTDSLGADLSCYWGSVRLYWPHLAANNDPRFHPLWTGERLRSSGHDGFATRERFRKQLRGLIFRAAALSVVRPREIDVIRDAADQAAVTALRERASSVAEFEQLANAYAADADKLRSERAGLRTQLEELEAQVSKLEADVAKLAADRQGLQAHLNAKTRAVEPSSGDEIAPSAEDETRAVPSAGEVRFYKKVFASPSHDLLVRVKDCGCNNWENAHAADKARKGIAKLEGNRSDWKALQHCATCTGGGMWKVRW